VDRLVPRYRAGEPCPYCPDGSLVRTVDALELEHDSPEEEEEECNEVS